MQASEISQPAPRRQATRPVGLLGLLVILLALPAVEAPERLEAGTVGQSRRDRKKKKKGSLDLGELRESVDALTSKNCALLRPLAHLGGGVYELNWSPDGKLLALNTAPGIQLYRLQGTGKKTESVLEGIIGPTAIFTASCFVKGGGFLATCEGGARIQLWDVSTRRVTEETDLGDAEVVSMDSDPLGTLLAVTATDGQLRVWADGALGEPPRTVDISRTEVVDAAGVPISVSVPGSEKLRVSPRSGVGATWSYKKIRLWDLNRASLLAELEADERVQEVAFHPGGAKLFAFARTDSGPIFTPDSEREIRGYTWTVPSGEPQDEVTLGTGWFEDIRMHPSKDAWVLCKAGEVQVLDSKTGKGLGTLVKPGRGISYKQAFFNPRSGDSVALVSNQGVELRDLRSRRQLWSTSLPTRNLSASFSPSPDRDWMVWGESTGSLNLLHLTRSSQPKTLRSKEDLPFNNLTVGPGAKFLAANIEGRNRLFRLWRVQSNRLVPVKTLKSNWNWVQTAAFSPDGRWLAVVTQDREPILEIFSFASGKLSSPIELPRGDNYTWLQDLEFSPDGSVLAVSLSGVSSIPLIDTATWEVRSKLTAGGSRTWLGNLAFSADGRLLAVASQNTLIFDVERRRLRTKLDTSNWTPSDLLFSRDGKLLVLAFHSWASTHGHTRLDVHDLETGKRLSGVLSNLSGPTGLTFSSDGKLLVSAGGGSLRWWGAPRDGASGAAEK